MKSLLCLSIFLVLVLSCFSQDTTLIKVVKKGEEKPTEFLPSGEASRNLFGLIDWWQLDPNAAGGAAGFSFTGDVEPYVGTEYSISEKETAHYYNLGLDVGTERLMLGFGAKLPNNSPFEGKQRVLFSSRVYTKFNFRPYSTKRFNLVGAPQANFQVGVEFNRGSVQVPIPETNVKEKTVFKYVSPFLGVAHPVFETMYLGARLSRNMNTSGQESYTSLSAQISRVF